MLRLTLSSLVARKRRLLGTCAAVLLGVAFLSGTLVLGDTLRGNFDSLFTDAYATTDAQVRRATDVAGEAAGARGAFDAAVLDEVRSVPGVETADPQVNGYGRLIGSGREGDRWQRPADAGRLVDDRQPAQPVPPGRGSGAAHGERGRDQPRRGEGRRPARR